MRTRDYSIVVGGDFNVIFDQDIDGSGGVKKKKDSVKYLEDICLDQDLVDIWRGKISAHTLQEDVEAADTFP